VFWWLVLIVGAIVVFFIVRSSLEERARNQQREKGNAYERQLRAKNTTANAIIDRRLAAERAFVAQGIAAVDVKSGYNSKSGKWHGQIVTATGKLLWQCRSGHSRRGSRFQNRREASQEAARECARRELRSKPQHYGELAGARVGDGTKSRRREPSPNGYDNWAVIKKAFDGACAYCGERSDVLHADHVIPLSVGGPNDYGNVLPACARCNLAKGTLRLDEFLRKRNELGIPSSRWLP